MIQKFRKKPVVIDAVQWTGENLEEIRKFCSHISPVINPIHSVSYKKNENERANDLLGIPTSEGFMTASLNDWIIKGIQGEFYPCKPDIFAKTYEKVSDKKESTKCWIMYHAGAFEWEDPEIYTDIDQLCREIEEWWGLENLTPEIIMDLDWQQENETKIEESTI
jgi:hypothetical protein